MPNNGFLKPRIVEVKKTSTTQAKVVMEPFERGYGHTLGNALRRILLSSMSGAAPTEVKISGVLHEYATIDGVQEDVVDILLNLKGVVLRMHNMPEVVLSLTKSGSGIVTAGDISAHADVEVVNPDHVIAHLTAGGKLDMQIKVEQGRGYVSAISRQTPNESRAVGHIALDASFSPVSRVSYAVESARVEQRTDLDKLVMNIETNGAVPSAFLARTHQAASRSRRRRRDGLTCARPGRRRRRRGRLRTIDDHRVRLDPEGKAGGACAITQHIEHRHLPQVQRHGSGGEVRRHLQHETQDRKSVV
jgi:hypothetical protein